MKSDYLSRSASDWIFFALIALGLHVAVAAGTVSSVPWAIVGFLLMLVGLIYFGFEPEERPETNEG